MRLKKIQVATIRTSLVSWLVCLVVPFVLTGCPGCDDYAAAGIFAVVRDAASGATISNGIVVVAIEGEYSDTLRNYGSGNYSGAYERAGTYQVVVTSPNYVPLFRGGVRVEQDGCHVRTAKIELRINRVAT